MKKAALVLMLLTIFSKTLGFTRDIALSYFYGASNISDAYLISLTIPLTIFDFIGTGLGISYIPMYSNIVKESSIKSADRFTSNITNIILLLCTFLVLIGIIFTVPIVKLFASGFEGETLNLAVKLTKISIIGIYFSSLVYVFSGYLNLNKNFWLPALIGIPFNIFIITSIALSAKFSTIILSIGCVLALASQFILLIPFSYKKGFRYSFVLDRRDKYLRKMIIMSLPVIIGVSVNQINVIVDRTIASYIATGGISALTYANRLNWFVQGIVVSSIATVMYPTISKLAAESNMFGFKRSLTDAISGVNFLVIPSTVGFMIFAKPLVKFLFGRGAFDSEDIAMTSYVLFYFSIGMFGFGLREVLSRAFYSLQDTRTPIVNASIAMAMNIVLNIVLSKFLGIGGLALATSISGIFCTILLFISLSKKIGSLDLKRLLISFAKILIASIIMGILSKFFYMLLINTVGLSFSLVLSIIVAIIVYFVMTYFLRIEGVNTFLNILKRKAKTNGPNSRN